MVKFSLAGTEPGCCSTEGLEACNPRPSGHKQCRNPEVQESLLGLLPTVMKGINGEKVEIVWLV